MFWLYFYSLKKILLKNNWVLLNFWRGVYNVVSSRPRLNGIRNLNVSGDMVICTDYIGSCKFNHLPYFDKRKTIRFRNIVFSRDKLCSTVSCIANK